MTPEAFSALAAFAFATSITPGPNNLMLMSSGATFGLRRTLPHLLGVSGGFVVLASGVGLGLTRLFDAWPPSYSLLKILSAVYLGWLALRIARAGAPNAARTGASDGVKGRPLTMMEAAAFQWVNPKALAMALSATALYAPDHSVASILAVALIFGAINLPSVGAWAILGSRLRGWLAWPARLRAFNRTMAALLIVSALPMLA